MKSVPFILIAGFLLLANSASVAQAPREPGRPPDGGTREMLISILIPSLPNAPFTATVNTEWVRQLADGATITLRNHRAIARDSAGRIFQERRALVADDGKQDSPITQIEISDPVSHDLYICVPPELVCQVEVFSPPEGAHFSAAAKAPKSPALEDLGKQFIGGVEAIGARETVVIQTGAIGNDRPLMAKREFWYSPGLGINLISKRQDPRFGTQNFEITDIVLGEPDAKMFGLPPGFKVIDLRKTVETSTQPPPSH
ncbi:MAG TPA: hypothetical protein VJN92_08695 [Candidatus Acidoferrum sp.]|nr:hypothetical protein [Candidatus Acidoferrum sp.]